MQNKLVSMKLQMRDEDFKLLLLFQIVKSTPRQNRALPEVSSSLCYRLLFPNTKKVPRSSCCKIFI